MNRRLAALALSAALVLGIPAASYAQTGDSGSGQATQDDSDFPWGLLGLAGLAGLLGLKRNDRDHNRR